jgi:hypothetical protein
MGNRGSIGAGDIQWMTAGRGIIHQEMPTGDAGGRMHGFQLWANLPSSLTMTVPRYQDVKAKVTICCTLAIRSQDQFFGQICIFFFGCLLFHSQQVGWERTTSPHCPQQLMASCCDGSDIVSDVAASNHCVSGRGFDPQESYRQ